MFCPKCGKELKEGAKFCGSCGATVGAAVPAAPEPTAEPGAAAPAVAEAAAATGAAAAKDAAAATSKKSKKPLVIGIVVVIVVAVAVAVFAIGGSPLPTTASEVTEDLIKEDLQKESSILEGFVDSDYTNPSDYEITDVKIESQEEDGSEKIHGLIFTATIANENFESQFTGQASYKIINDEWRKTSDIEVTNVSTKPLKGVDFVENPETTGMTFSDFSSDLTESNGVYRSVASQLATYDVWFVKETAKVEETYAFDPNSGWRLVEDSRQTSDVNSEYKIGEKSYEQFDFSNAYNNGKSKSCQSISATFAIGPIEGNAVTLEYSVNAGPSNDNWKAVEGRELQYLEPHFYSVQAAGTMTGTIAHDFGVAYFEIDLSDPDHGAAMDIVGFKSEDSASGYALRAGTTIDQPYCVVRGDESTFVASIDCVEQAS